MMMMMMMMAALVSLPSSSHRPEAANVVDVVSILNARFGSGTLVQGPSRIYDAVIISPGPGLR